MEELTVVASWGGGVKLKVAEEGAGVPPIFRLQSVKLTVVHLLAVSAGILLEVGK